MLSMVGACKGWGDVVCGQIFQVDKRILGCYDAGFGECGW